MKNKSLSELSPPTQIFLKAQFPSLLNSHDFCTVSLSNTIFLKKCNNNPESLSHIL
jgi:hypothetical protein